MNVIDFDFVYDGLKAAACAITVGKSLEDGILVGRYGQSTTVGKALVAASLHLPGQPHDEDLPIFKQALTMAGSEHTLGSEAEIASALIRSMTTSLKFRLPATHM